MKKITKAMLLAVALIACLAFSSCTGGIVNNPHEIKNSKGVTLCVDDAINTADEAAQAKLNKYLVDDGNAEEMKTQLGSDEMTVDVYARGNTMVLEYNITVDVTDEQAKALKEEIQPRMSAMSITDGRKETGVDNLVVAYAVLDNKNNIIVSDVFK